MKCRESGNLKSFKLFDICEPYHDEVVAIYTSPIQLLVSYENKHICHFQEFLNCALLRSDGLTILKNDWPFRYWMENTSASKKRALKEFKR